MLASVFTALLAVPAAADASNGTTATVLNSFARFMGESQFDPSFLTQVEAVLDEHNLAGFTDRFWQGFLDFSKGPDWGKANGTGWIEYDPRQMDIGPVVYEVCNTVSNLAYYRTMLEMSSLKSSMLMDQAYVDALIQTYSMSAVGSSLFHAAGGHEGDLDTIPIGLMSYIAHQSSVSGLSAGASGNSSALHDLSPVPRPLAAPALAQAFVDAVNEDSWKNWTAAVQKNVGDNQPDYFDTFGAILAGWINLVLPSQASTTITELFIEVTHLSPDQ